MGCLLAKFPTGSVFARSERNETAIDLAANESIRNLLKGTLVTFNSFIVRHGIDVSSLHWCSSRHVSGWGGHVCLQNRHGGFVCLDQENHTSKCRCRQKEDDNQPEEVKSLRRVTRAGRRRAALYINLLVWNLSRYVTILSLTIYKEFLHKNIESWLRRLSWRRRTPTFPRSAWPSPEAESFAKTAREKEIRYWKKQVESEETELGQRENCVSVRPKSNFKGVWSTICRESRTCPCVDSSSYV